MIAEDQSSSASSVLMLIVIISWASVCLVYVLTWKAKVPACNNSLNYPEPMSWAEDSHFTEEEMRPREAHCLVFNLQELNIAGIQTQAYLALGLPLCSCLVFGRQNDFKQLLEQLPMLREVENYKSAPSTVTLGSVPLEEMTSYLQASHWDPRSVVCQHQFKAWTCE